MLDKCSFVHPKSNPHWSPCWLLRGCLCLPARVNFRFEAKQYHKAWRCSFMVEDVVDPHACIFHISKLWYAHLPISHCSALMCFQSPYSYICCLSTQYPTWGSACTRTLHAMHPSAFSSASNQHIDSLRVYRNEIGISK